MRTRPDAPLTGRLIVVLSRAAVAQIAERVSQPSALDLTTLGGLGEALGDTTLVEVLRRWAERSFPAVRSLSIAEILRLDRMAAEGPFPPSRSMISYWIVVPSQPTEPGVDPRAMLMQGLLRSPSVERVDLEKQVGPPPVNRTNNDYGGAQVHLDPAPTGVNADWVWSTLLLDGAGITFADVERGWLDTHEDLTTKMPAALLTGQNDADSNNRNHGTAVLGLVVGVDNDKGIVGVATGVNAVVLASHWDGSSANNVADAIEKVADVLNRGDVLLLETQSGDEGPIETMNEAEKNAIKTATSKGIVVIEPAGNAGAFMDAAWPELADDSGAIVVGASNGVGGTVQHPRNILSNYGKRADCFATGWGLVSAGYGDLDGGGGDDDKEYTSSFRDTSGASAVVAGAAILAQHMHVDACGSRLDSPGMRSLLTHDGTKQGAMDGNIGIMPDLRKVARRLCDVYVRDYVGDTGTVPGTGPLSLSPDVIVRRAPVADPQVSFGEGSGTEDDGMLGEPITPNHPHSVYVRMRNRGMCPAKNVQATVYWSEVATLVTPGAWKQVGVSGPVTVPPGDVLTVAPAIPWAATDVPAPGHYCFVVTVDHPYDPRPPSPAATDWNGFLAFIREFNNVSWRNFNVVNLEDFSINRGLWFTMRGFPDLPRPFDFEIESRLPQEAALFLEVPSQLLPFLHTGRFAASPQSREKRLRVQLPPGPSARLEAVRVDGTGHRCRFYVTGKLNRLAAQSGSVIIRQLYKGSEVGRITWAVRPPEGVRRDHR